MIEKYGKVTISDEKIDITEFHFGEGKVSINEVLLWAKKILEEQLEKVEYIK